MSFDPLVPRPIDLPTPVPESDPLDVLDSAKIISAPDDPAEWPAWRNALERWRVEARERVGYDGSGYEDPVLEWTQSCFSVALLWLWDERLYDREAGRFTPDALLDEAEREHGGFDGVVLWHAYPVIGIDDRNQFDYYRDVPGLRELVAAFQARHVRVFVDYNPWDTGTRREPVDDSAAIAELVQSLGVDGVFLDTMKQAMPGLREATTGLALEGESTLPLTRIHDHHLSWAQWFADSPVPGVIRARWFEQRHMLHHTRRWNRDHAEELRSAWLNGVGMLVWENVFGTWVGWNERDRATLRGMVDVQRRHADLLTHGEWTPLAAHSHDLQVVGSHWRLGETELWTLANRHPKPFAGVIVLAGNPVSLTIPPNGLAAVMGDERSGPSVAGAPPSPHVGSCGATLPSCAPTASRPEWSKGRRRVLSWPTIGAARQVSMARRSGSRSGSRCHRASTARPRWSGRRRAGASQSGSGR